MANPSDPTSVLTEAVKSGSTIRVQNVINPLLRLSSFAFPSGLAGAVFLHESPVLAAAAFAVGAMAPVATLVAYAYFALHAPERLHSEEFLLAQQRLTLEMKEGELPDSGSLQIDLNPEYRPLPNERGHDR